MKRLQTMGKSLDKDKADKKPKTAEKQKEADSDDELGAELDRVLKQADEEMSRTAKKKVATAWGRIAINSGKGASGTFFFVDRSWVSTTQNLDQYKHSEVQNSPVNLAQNSMGSMDREWENNVVSFKYKFNNTF